MTKLIVPQWPMSQGVGACSSTRTGGVSASPRGSLNPGAHFGEHPGLVEENRRRVFVAGGFTTETVWRLEGKGKTGVEPFGEAACS